MSHVFSKTKYAASLALVALAGVWWGFDTGQHSQAKADAQQVLAWAASAEIPTVQETYPGKLPVAIVRDGYCLPYPQHLPATFHVQWVAPNYEPCATQHYVQPTTVSPALAAIEEHVHEH